jgi:hypothetical protein
MSYKNLVYNSEMSEDEVFHHPCVFYNGKDKKCKQPITRLIDEKHMCYKHEKKFYGGNTQPKTLSRKLKSKPIDISSDESEEDEFIKYSDDSESNYDELSENSADLNSVSEDDTYDESSENSYDSGNESEESSVEESNKELKRKREPEEDMAHKKQRKIDDYGLFEEFMTQNTRYKNEIVSIETMYCEMQLWMNDILDTNTIQLPWSINEFTEYLISKKYIIIEGDHVFI